MSRRSLHLRLSLLYGAGAYLAGTIVVIIVAIVVSGTRRTVTVGGAPTVQAPQTGIDLHKVIAGAGIGLLVLLPITFILGWYAANRVLSPLRAITTTAREISASDLHRRLGLGPPNDELTELAGTLDELFERLQAAFDAHRHFVANASHELRTPLAGLRTLMEVTLADPKAPTDVLREACADALTLSEQLEGLTEALLTLATSERGVEISDVVDLSAMARAALAVRRGELTSAKLQVDEDLAAATTAGDPRLIESLVSNLLDNAIRHNQPGGCVRVRTESVGRHALLTVINTGPNVPEASVDRLVQPFARLTGDLPRSSGHGLGLAIVDAVVRAHGGELTIRAGPEGGLRVVVRLDSALDAGRPR